MSEIREKLGENGIESLSVSERFRYINTLQGGWGTYESAFYARELGVLGELEWERFHSAICRNYNRELYDGIWDRDVSGDIVDSITTTFRNYIDSSCTIE